ncbi:MAG: LPS-assembly protein LptD [Bacteroidales bacterium]|nr:LPS-assembly protein LptD [Bacteroidales bacterium]MBN2757299.1 LPS-assembly protein LptD [Bacteroidales bacterium]
MPKDSILVDSTSFNKNKSNEIKSPINYSAKDSMMMSIKTKMIFSYGDAKLSMDDMQLDAGFIKMNMDSDYLFAKSFENDKGELSGQPKFVQGDKSFDVETIRYNFETKKGVITNVITEEGGGYLHGTKTKIQPNKEIHILDGKYTTCDAKHPHFYIELTKAKVLPDDKIVSGPFYFVIADIPIPIGLPFGWFPNQKDNSSGIIIPSYGEEKRRGFYLSEGGYYFAINDYVNLAVLGEIYTNGSWGVRAQSSYKKRYKYSGSFNIKYQENIISEPDIKDYSKSTMFWVKLSYNRDTKANPTSSFNTNLDFGTSKFKQYNSYDPNDFANNTASSSIAYTKSWLGLPFNFSANISATQNLTDQNVNMEAPTLSFNINKQFPFKRASSTGGSKWYEKIGVGFSSNLRNTLNIGDSLVFTQEAVEKMQNGFKYNIPISTNFNIFKFIIFSPGFNYNGRIYTDYLNKNWHDYEILNGDTIQNEGFYTDTISGLRHNMDFTFSAPLSTKLYGIVQFKKGKIAAIRHVASPSISFSYRPDFSDDKWGYYKTDPSDTTLKTSYSIYQNGIFGTPPSGKSGTISFGLSNNLEMKVHSKDTTEEFKKIKLLESLNFSTGYNIAADSLNWSPISISASTTLLKQINVQYSGSILLYTLNDLGQQTNTTYFEKYKVLGHLSSSRFSLGGTLSSETFKKKSDTNTNETNSNDRLDRNTSKNQLENDDLNSDLYNDLNTPENTKVQTGDFSFNAPWSLNINYSLNYNSTFNIDIKKYEPKYTQTVNLSANLSLTPKWKISGSMQYDIQENKIVYTSMNIYRDLHCWEMSFNFVPLGTYKSYNFRINIKSSIFKGIEYKRQNSWRDNIEF